MQNAISLQITCHPRQSDRRGNQCPRLTTNHRLNPAPTIHPQTPKNQFQSIPRQNTPHHHPPIVSGGWGIIYRCRSGIGISVIVVFIPIEFNSCSQSFTCPIIYFDMGNSLDSLTVESFRKSSTPCEQIYGYTSSLP